MRLKPGGEWKPFEARQWSAQAEPFFVWHARFAGLEVVDALVDEGAVLEARLLGALRIVHEQGEAVMRGQLLRYLGELIWFPPALRDHPRVRWEEQSETTLRATLDWNGTEVELDFDFDAEGKPVRAHGLRERVDGRDCVLTPWVGRFSDFRTLGGAFIPARAEAIWELPDGPFSYWRAELQELSFKPHEV